MLKGFLENVYLKDHIDVSKLIEEHKKTLLKGINN